MIHSGDGRTTTTNVLNHAIAGLRAIPSPVAGSWACRQAA
jgi:hypothetical protein